MKTAHFTMILSSLACSCAQGAVLANSGFDDGSLSSWYLGRHYGGYRTWMIGSLDPHSGDYYAFNLGQLELRQDFTPVPGSDITQFSFYVAAQFANLGNPLIELFYSDGSTSGSKVIPLNPAHATGSKSSGWQWDKVDLLGFVDKNRQVSGVSVTGISGNVLSIDSFTLTTVPESSIAVLLTGSLLGLALQRKRFAS